MRVKVKTDPYLCECGHGSWRHDKDVGCMLETYDFKTKTYSFCSCFTFIVKEVIPTKALDLPTKAADPHLTEGN